MREARKILVTVLCATLLAAGVGTAAASPADVRQTTMDAAVLAGVPGMVAVASDGSAGFRGSSGVADVDGPGKPDPAGRFRVGSVSKSFTATLVLQLVAKGEITLDDPISRYLPDLLPYPEPITVHELLQHTSGLPRDLAPQYTWAKLSDFDTQRFTHFNEVEAIHDSTVQPLLFKPGTAWSYSNTGFNVLARLVEKVSGRSYEQLLAENITGPLHLRGTFLPRDFPFLPNAAAHGYEQLYPAPKALTDVTTYNYSRYFGAGDLISSAKDLNTFFHALLTGGLLPAAQLAEMKTTVPTGVPGNAYGLGLMSVDLQAACGVPLTIWGHGGDVAGFNTLAFSTASADKQITTLATLDLTASPQAQLDRQLPMANEFCTPHLPPSANAARSVVPAI
jgi:D-alanyl-D-alanine carboxypeptidase